MTKKIINSPSFTWQELSELYLENPKRGGLSIYLSIYHFGNPVIEAELTYCPIYVAKFNEYKEININWTGQAPINWRIISGDLPPGMDFTMITQKDSPFRIAGTPTKAGTYSITLQAEDKIKLLSDPFTLQIIVRSLYTREEKTLSAGESVRAEYIIDTQCRRAIYNQ